MTKSSSDKPDKADKTSGGGHVGGTYFGQKPDAKTATTTDKKGDKARPNDGRN